MEWHDFQTLWEQRFIEVAKPFLDPAPANYVEGARTAEWVDGSTFGVAVQPVAEDPPRSGFWLCTIVAFYEYDPGDSGESVSRTWGQILEAMGDGADGSAELRTRLASGRLAIPGGIGSVRYDGAIDHDPDEGIYNFTFSAHLSLRQAVA